MSTEPMPLVPCPVGECPGHVFVRALGGIKAFGCDGPAQHGDATVRAGMVAESDGGMAEDRAELDRLERRIDEVVWLQDRIERAAEPPDEKFDTTSMDTPDSLPVYATGFIGRERGMLMELRGMTTLSGKASSGKSWFALGAAVQSALDGWNVEYIAAEGEDVIRRRIFAALGHYPPTSLRLHSVQPSVDTDDLIQAIRWWVRSPRTLLVIDSVSTLMGLMDLKPHANRWEEQSRLEMFLLRIRTLTRGAVGILVISESNAQGEVKGRSLDYRSDLSIHFQSVEDSDAKEIRVRKAWEGQTGLVGRARVDPKGPGLKLIHEGSVADAEPSEGSSW